MTLWESKPWKRDMATAWRRHRCDMWYQRVEPIDQTRWSRFHPNRSNSVCFWWRLLNPALPHGLGWLRPVVEDGVTPGIRAGETHGRTDLSMVDVPQRLDCWVPVNCTSSCRVFMSSIGYIPQASPPNQAPVFPVDIFVALFGLLSPLLVLGLYFNCV